MRHDNDVVVTGLGVLTSICTGKDSFAEALRSGTCGVSRKDDGFGVAARLNEFNFSKALEVLNLPDQVAKRALRAGKRSPIAAQTAIVTALEAWMDAFGEYEAPDMRRINLFVAGSNFSSGYHYGMGEKYRESLVSASYALHFLDTDVVGLISEILGVNGEGCTVGGASASGNMSIIQAYRQVKYGLCDACIVIGPMADLAAVELQAFEHTGALGGKKFLDEPLKASRPFDEEREGFIYGQGSASLVIESKQCAAQREKEIYGEIAGCAMCLDGNRSTNPSMEGEVRVMKQALEEANVAASDVSYVNAHGTSSRLGDEVEVAAIEEVFSEAPSFPVVNSTKGLTGHCLFSASLVEAVATLVQIDEGFVHPNKNLNQALSQKCHFAGLESSDCDLQIAVSNAFGFGGINTSVVFAK